MDCQGLVARLVMDFVLLTTAVEVAGRWRELAEKLIKVSRQQMDAYEAPHRDVSGVVDSEVCRPESITICFLQKKDFTWINWIKNQSNYSGQFKLVSSVSLRSAVNMQMCDIVV